MSIDEHLISAGIPAMAANLEPTKRVALGDPYKTASCQWVIDDGVAELCGEDDDAPDAPDAALIQLVVDTFASYVEPELVVFPMESTIRRAMAKSARGKTLTQEEEDALDYCENC